MYTPSPPEHTQVDLIDNGGEVPVTNANRHEYVKLYTQHLLDRSIHRQFTAFKRGFLKMCESPALALFRPEELELLVCGSQRLDFFELQSGTQYLGGYNRSHEAVGWFWEVVHDMPTEQKKRLLFFVTGSDRVPIKGLANLSPPFTIARNGPGSHRLPTAHTCFNHLMLPQYKVRVGGACLRALRARSVDSRDAAWQRVQPSADTCTQRRARP